MSKYVFGVDVGGTSVKMGLFNAEGEVLQKWEIPTRVENNGINILPDIADSILKVLTSKNLKKTDIIGIGVGVPGPVDGNGILYCAVNIGWGKMDIEKELSELTGLYIKAGNDANVAALGEMWKGGGKGYKSLVAVTLGTGIGGGVIIDGKLLSGFTGAGGEIGHVHVMDEEPNPCGCGNHGCLEQYGSATGIVTLAKRVLSKNDKESVLRNKELSAKAVFDAVKEGDEVANEIAEWFGEILGKGLAVIASIINPEAFVIGGGVSKAGECLFDFIRPPFEKYVFKGSKSTEFVLAKLGNDAGIYGAAKLVIDRKIYI